MNTQEISNYKIVQIKSNYILKKIYVNMIKNRTLAIIKCNKNIQKRLNVSIKDYKECCGIFSSIELEIIPIQKNKYSRFININENEKSYYHIYFNDNKKEIKNVYFIYETRYLKKIKIVIDYKVKSLAYLFNDCNCIRYINFKKYYRNNIYNINNMFSGCKSIEKIDFSKFNYKYKLYV